MGTTGSIVVKDKNVEMNIEHELNVNTKGRGLKKRHSSPAQNMLPSLNARSKDGRGMQQSASLRSIDTSHLPNPNVQLPIAVRKENEFKITKEQEIQALQRKEQKLDMENNHLRAEVYALNKQCQKLRAERDTAFERCHDATERAIALEQDREKIQRQFKIFREAKESEIQALLQEKRKLEGLLHRTQAHGVATGDDHHFTSSAESLKQQIVIPDSPTPPNHWWGAAESETTSLFGSFAQIRNSLNAEPTESLPDVRSSGGIQNEKFLSVGPHAWQLTTSSNFGSNSMLPEYSELEYLERTNLRCYITCTPDCQKEVNSLVSSQELKQLQENCAQEGCFLSFVTLEGLNSQGSLLSTCNRSVSVDEIIMHGITVSDLVICFLGHEAGRYTELECQIAHFDDPGLKQTLFCLKKDKSRSTPVSEVCSSLRSAVEKSKNRSLKYFENSSDGVGATVKEIMRTVKLELGVSINMGEDVSDDVGCVDEMQLDESIEQEQREIALIREDDMKPVGFQRYYERLNDLVISPGPLPPLLISGSSGSGKTMLIKTWIEYLKKMQQGAIVFHHYVTNEKSPSADPVIMMRRLLSQIFAQLPPSQSPPSFAVSSYDAAHLKSLLPRWLERLSTSKRIILAVDSMDLIPDAKSHFKWLLDPLPVGVRIVISVGVDSCPDVWRKWPTLHLEPLSFQSVCGLVNDASEQEGVKIPGTWVNDITSHCRSASTCHPLFVMLLLRVVCSACSNSRKEMLMRSCLKAHDSAEMYKILLRNIEEDCISVQVQQQMRQVLQLVSCSRDGLNERELLGMVPGLTWHTWLCMRCILVRFLILTERAGLILPHNSQIALLLHELFVPDKSNKILLIRTLVQYFSQNSSPKYPRTAKILLWLVFTARSENHVRECLLHPYIFYHLYRCSRASEIVEYWQTFEKNKQNIVQSYVDMLTSIRNPKQGRRSQKDDSGRQVAKKRRGLFPDHLDTTLSPIMLANVYEAVGRFFRDLGLLENAVSALQRSMEIRESELDPEHPLVANSLHYLASAYTKWTKYNMAEPLFKQSLELVECMAGREHPRVIEELQSLSYILHKQERHEQADLVMKRIHSIQNRNGGTLFTSSRLDRLKKRTVKLEELALGQESVNLARAINELGVLCYVQKNYTSAESFLERSLAMQEKLLGEDHADVAQCLHNLSAIYNEQKKYGQAVDCMKRALEIRQEVYGPHNPLVLSTTKHLALLYKKSKKYEKAREVYQQLLDLSEQMNGEDSSATATALVNLAVVECELSEHKSALPLYERALKIYSSKHGSTSKQAADTLRNIAVLRYEQKEFEEAALLYKKSLKIKEELKAKNSWR